MIVSFRDEETRKLFVRDVSRRFPLDIQRTALRKLVMLDAATCLLDLTIPPANHLEKLTKKRRGQYSIRINDQWRICFRWQEGHVHEVEITDYH